MTKQIAADCQRCRPRRLSFAAVFGTTSGDHISGEGKLSEWSLSKSCLRASFPALLAVVMVSKYTADCSIGLVLPAR
jgi:hypothetical protein